MLHNEHEQDDRKTPVIVVSGLPRSGTSMMMAMLEAGGIPLFTDHVRKPDEDNPRGYYEVERIKQLKKERDSSWVGESCGKVMKAVSYFLSALPNSFQYDVIFMERDLTEVLRSQNKMLARRQEPIDPAKDQETVTLYQKHLAQVRSWLAQQPNFSILYVNHRDVLTASVAQAQRVGRFLGKELDLQAMSRVVDNSLYRNRASA